MHTYAQTNVQLFNQLRSEGYSKEDRDRVLHVYEFGMRLFTGIFLPTGRPFFDHLVGTASVLASLHVPVNVVAASLIHAAYRHGDFGGVRKGISEKKRRQVRRAVGEAVEEYVARYERLLWEPQSIPVIHGTLDGLSPVDRDVLLMRLANELEHELDLGGLYFARSEKEQGRHQRDIERHGPILMEMSDRLGVSSLSAEMERVFKAITTAQLPVTPLIQGKKVTYSIAPQSYCERLSVTFCRTLLSGSRWGAGIVDRARSKCCRSYQYIRQRFRPIFSPHA